MTQPLTTNNQILQDIFGALDRRCLWQIVPSEIPEDMRAMALGLWQTKQGLWLIQMFIEGSRGGDWYSRIGSYIVFKQDISEFVANVLPGDDYEPEPEILDGND